MRTDEFVNRRNSILYVVGRPLPWAPLFLCKTALFGQVLTEASTS